jgi:hypothetical protein
VPATDLLEAMVAQLQGDTAVTSMLAQGANSIVGDELAAAGLFPYVVLIEVSGPTEYQTTDGSSYPYDDHPSFQLTVVGTGKEPVRQIAHAVQHSLLDAALSFTTGTLQLLRRSGPAFDSLDPDRGPGGIDVFRRVLLFESIVSRTI